jgi:predicted unusual protein kinase regulating ubiquinone biosynthesis (AarF/ABC1/UbiB family)
MSDKPPGRLSRLLQLGAMTGRVASSYVREGIKATLGRASDAAELDRVHVENARDLAQGLAQLKGAAMKLGQQLALFSDVLNLPEEVRDTLSRLNAKAEPVPFAIIQADVEHELQRPLSETFAWFDPHPLGTASLAQAHAATLLDGRDVVVKVLHRGVEKSVHTDVLAFKTLLLSQVRAFGRTKEELDEVFVEIQQRLEEELDYLQEAANIAAFSRVIPAGGPIRIPSVYADLSTKRVLVLDRVAGVDLDTFVDMASAAARQRAGAALVDFTFDQIFRYRMLHADPHPGNYLFSMDGSVGLVDFGCVKRFDPFFLGTYARAAIALLDGDREGALAACVELGAWDGRRPEAADALWAFLDAIGVGFRRGVIRLGSPEERMLDRLRDPALALIQFPEIRAPRDVIFLHRSIGGLYAIGRRIGTELDFGAILRAYAERAVAVAEGRG